MGVSQVDLSRLRNELLLNITNVLPHLEDDTASALVEHFIKKGLKKMATLRHVSLIQLEEFVDPMDALELHSDWQEKYNAASCSSSSHANASASASATTTTSASSAGSSTASHTGANASGSMASQPPPRQPLQAIAANIVEDPVPIFDVTSPYMPSAVKQAVLAKKRPSKSARVDFVERVVDRCCELVPSLQRTYFDEVARRITVMYPESFKDTHPISEHGSDTLAGQMRAKLSNHRRNKKALTTREVEAPARKEAFGCIRWNPKLPEDQSIETMEQIKTELQSMHTVSRRDWNWRVIKPKLSDSYFLQRKEINGSLALSTRARKRNQTEETPDDPTEADLTIVQLHSKWPFLFTSRGINFHFNLLTGLDFKDKLSDFITEEGPDLVEFLGSQNDTLRRIYRRMRKAEKQGHGQTTLGAVVLMLISYLKEERNDFITFVDNTTTLESASDSALPYPEEGTPFLVCAGNNVYDFDHIYFSVDKKILTTVNSLQDAVVIFFTSHYVFNYLYSSNLSSLLVYFQRIVAQVQSSTGSKCKTSQILKRSNERVTKLANKFAEYKQNIQDEENENPNA